MFLGEEHYNCVSALIKSMRGSDDSAAIYWLMRMLEGGEDPKFVARRLVAFASEDVGTMCETFAYFICPCIYLFVCTLDLCPKFTINIYQELTHGYNYVGPSYLHIVVIFWQITFFRIKSNNSWSCFLFL